MRAGRLHAGLSGGGLEGRVLRGRANFAPVFGAAAEPQFGLAQVALRRQGGYGDRMVTIRQGEAATEACHRDGVESAGPQIVTLASGFRRAIDDELGIDVKPEAAREQLRGAVGLDMLSSSPASGAA